MYRIIRKIPGLGLNTMGVELETIRGDVAFLLKTGAIEEVTAKAPEELEAAVATANAAVAAPQPLVARKARY